MAGFQIPTVLHYKTMTYNFSPDHSRRWSLGLQKRLSSSQISHWLWPLGLLMSWLGPGLLRHLWPGLLLWYLWSRLVCRLRSWLLGSLRFGLVSRLWLGLLRCLWPRLLWWLGPGLLLLLGWTGRRHSQFWIDSQFHQALLLLHLKIITIQKKFFKIRKLGIIYSQLSRCCTARGSRSWVCLRGPTKVVYSSHWKFPCSWNKEHLVDCIVTLYFLSLCFSALCSGKVSQSTFSPHTLILNKLVHCCTIIIPKYKLFGETNQLTTW